MRRRLIRLFPVLPLVDLVLLFVLGHIVGTGWVLLGWLVGVVAGFVVARIGGRRTWGALRDSGRTGVPAGPAAAGGAGLMCAGLLLALPGPLSDVAGLALLIPFVRHRAGHALAGMIAARATRATRTEPASGPLHVRSRRGPSVPTEPRVVDGEVRR